MVKYINEKTFKQFEQNQARLIEILNHNMSNLINDVKWIKRLIWWILGLISAILIFSIIKLIGG